MDKQRPTLGQVIRAYKATVTRRIRKKGDKEFALQCNYFEHIIHSEQTLHAIRPYIDENPTRWDLDRYNPNATGSDPQSKALWNLLESDHLKYRQHEEDFRRSPSSEGKEWNSKYEQR